MKAEDMYAEFEKLIADCDGDLKLYAIVCSKETMPYLVDALERIGNKKEVSRDLKKDLSEHPGAVKLCEHHFVDLGTAIAIDKDGNVLRAYKVPMEA